MRNKWVLAGLAAFILLTIVLGPGILSSVTRSAIEKSLPTRSLAEAEAEALSVSAPELARLSHADVIFSASETNLAPIIAAALTAAAAEENVLLEDVEVTFVNQGISVAGRADLVDVDRDVEASVRFTGVANLGLDSERLVITPALSGIEVLNLRAGWLFVPRSVTAVISNLARTAISAINAAVDPVELALPTLAIEGGSIALGAVTIDYPPQEVFASAILIGDDRLLWIGQVSQPSAAEVPATAFPAYRERFLAIAGPMLEGLPPDGLRFAPDILGPIYADLVDTGSLEDRVAAAYERAVTAAQAMYRTDLTTWRPDLALFLPSDLIREAVEPELIAKLQAEAKDAGVEVSSAELAFRDGYIEAAIEGVLSYDEPVPARVQLRVVVTAIPTFANGRVEIRPGLQEISIRDAEAEGYDPAAILVPLNGVLAGLVESLDAALPAIPIDVDPYAVGTIDLAGLAESGVTFSRDNIEGPVISLSEASVFVTASGLYLMAEVRSDSPSLAEPARGAPEIAPGFDGLAAYVLPYAQPGLQPPDKAIGGAALSWSRLAELLNAEFGDIGPLDARVTTEVPNTPFEPTKIELVERPNYQCRGPDDCPFNSCASECRRQDCDYGCPSACTKIPEFRGLKVTFKIRCVEEPGCVAGREVCKAGRETGYGACVLACNTAANSEVATCQAANVVRQGACEAGKAIQDLGAEVGGVGLIGGDAGAKPDLGIALAALTLNPNQLAGDVVARVGGTVDVDGSVSFVPYDTMNLLGCPKGKVSFSTRATIPAQQINLDVSVGKDPQPDDTNGVEDLDLLLTIAPFVVNADINPRPAEAILRDNPHLPFVCNPIIGAAFLSLVTVGRTTALLSDDLVRGATGDIKSILSGKLEHPVEATKILFPVEVMEITIGEKTYNLAPDLAGTAIAMTLVAN